MAKKSDQDNLETITDLFECYSNRKFADKLVSCAVCRTESKRVSLGMCGDCFEEFTEDYLEDAENS